MSDQAVTARRLLNHQGVGVLSTHSIDVAGYPFGSIAPYTLNYDGEPAILISEIAQHTRNIKQNNKVSLTVFKPDADDPQAGSRLTWIGDAESVDPSDKETRDRYLRYFPSAESYFETHDFSFYRIGLQRARFIGGFGQIFWIEADAMSLPSGAVDVVTMTGNVAQVFLADDEWTSVLRASQSAVHERGCLVFEARNPACRAWEHWTKAQTRRRVVVDGVGAVETWAETTSVALPFVTFRHTFVFEADATVLTSDSTLRFRSRTELIESVERAGLRVRDLRDAPDRPGLEFVVIAERADRRR
jgi:hypothetical protein